jgi:hypothetical protein
MEERKCEMCDKILTDEQGDVCSTQCGEDWVNKYLP